MYASARRPWRCTCSPGCSAVSPTDPAGDAGAPLRLFVALELPVRVLDALVEWQRSWAAALPGVRQVGREALHVTLCFLGMLPAGKVEAIGLACESVAGSSVRALALGDVLWLPRRRPNVLAVAIADNADRALAAVQRHVAESLVAAGAYAPERRPFLPHVTAGRVRRGTDVSVRGSRQPGSLESPPPLRFDAARV